MLYQVPINLRIDAKMKIGKVLTVMLYVLMIAIIFAVVVPMNVSASPADGECVIIIQAYEKSGEDASTNTVDALITGFKSFPGATVTALRPVGHTGTRGGTTYSNKQDLLNKLKAAACDRKCKNVVLIFVGHSARHPITH